MASVAQQTGVYQIRNVVNDKVYVGSTSQSFRQRWHEHRSDLQHNDHDNRYLQRAWNKYGPDAFVFDVLEVVNNPQQVVTREQAWMDHYRARGVELYNSAPEAGSSLGYRFTDEQRAANTERARQRNADPSFRERIRAWFSAHWSQPDARAAQSERTRRTMEDPDRRQRSSQAARAAWEAGVYDDRSSPEYRAKISQAKSRRVWPDLIAPDGTIYSGIRNLTAFCEAHGLHPSAMTRVYQGKRPSHKGWRLRYPEDASNDDG